MSLFDHMGDEEKSFARPKKPLWTIDLDRPENEKEIVKWLNGEVQFTADESHERIKLIRRNMALYRGIQYRTQETRHDIRDRHFTDRSRNIAKIVVNHLFDLTQNRVSRLVKFKPAVQVLPTNEEFEDVAAAKATGKLLDHIWYSHDFEGEMTPEIAKIANVMGESYLFITWNPDLGDKHPDSPEDGERVPLLDENGQQEKDSMGNPIWIEEPINVGDVDYEVVEPWNMYVQRVNRFEEVEYCFRRHVMHVEEARLKWPQAAKDIKASQGHLDFDFESFETRQLLNEVVIWEFYHKKTKGMPEGRYIVFTEDAVIENSELPYSHGNLPFVRYSDIDMPGVLHGVSFFETVKALTSTYNNITNMIQRNQVLVSHPKWMMPIGAAKLDSLGNDVTIVQYKGPVAPQLVQMNPTPAELFNYREQLKEEFQQISGVFGTSRGEPPSGITAAVALQFLNEQESERFNETILKWNNFIRNVALMTLSVAGDYYEADDERMIRVLGKNDRWQTVFFDIANLSKPYDIRVQNSSALPQSKAARIQTILDLSERFPEMFTQEQIIDMIDLGQSEKFMDMSAVAVRTAEAENELIMSGEKTAGVKEYEDHLLHWKIHVKTLQEYAFKEMTPPKVQDELKEHIKVHEYYLFIKSQTNPALAEQLSAEKMYPLFFETVPTEEPPVPGDQSPAPADGGVPLDGPIPQTPELPVNPDLGGEPQLPVQPEVPNEEALLQTQPTPGPIEPTGAI